MDKLYFGTYHHSTFEESEKMREKAKEMFEKAFKRIIDDRNKDLQIIDIGCGLGFLTILSASYFPKATITAVDLFTHSSLKENSKDILKNNLRIAQIYDRVKIVEADITDKLPSGKFDLAISNLVLHNLGKKRFIAYRNIHDVLKSGSYFINADGFIKKSVFEDPFQNDMKKISDIFDVDFVIKPENENLFFKYMLIALKSK
ncbi:class I SAM-dependent methyltransferase [Acidianus manzaensis]|uniref:Methyltransferase type 12 n=1 Tax=Acidianus manzaensis TaxID=282676 RepID=A0A1W6JWV2_9CREN|nr:class I SAM-dependent methyltransferase [Acidianus manzaensis]ARM74712.1 methyltransferase type 12 [Acidianus manzaensis]